MANVVIVNETEFDMRIAGNSSSCSCIVLMNAQQVIPVGKKLILPIQVRPEKMGHWRQRIIIYLEHPQQDRLVVDLVGNAVSKK